MIINYNSTNVDRSIIGGKAFNLLHLSKMPSIVVPKWLCLSTHFFEDFMSNNMPQYEALLADYKDGNEDKIIELINNTAFTDSQKDLIKHEISNSLNDCQLLSVRSSCTDEDSDDYSFAGMLESYLNVKNDDNLFSYIKKCFISCFSTRIMEYRKNNGLINKNIRMAVIIQEMIDADYAGVMFTINPKTNNTDEIYISTVKGLGEGLVSGEKNSIDNVVDYFGNIIKRDGDDLTDSQLQDLANVAKTIEDSYKFKCPQDIEFAIKNSQIFVLQCRPIAKFGYINKREYRTILDNSNIIESYSGVTTPLTFTFAQEVYGIIYRLTLKNFFIKDDVIKEIEDDLNHMLCFFENKIYYKLNSWYKMISLYPGYEKNKKYMENMMGVKTPLKENKVQSKSRNIKIYIRFIYKMLRMKKDSRLFLERFNQKTDKYKNCKFEGKTSQELVKNYEDLRDSIIYDFTTPIANDMGSMVFYGMLTDNLKKHKVPDYEGLLSSLLSRQGNVESAEQTLKLLEIVSDIKRDKDLQDKFLRKEIDLNSNYPVIDKLKEYIDKFGSRSMEELKLETITLDEDPSFLFDTINHYLSIDKNLEPTIVKSDFDESSIYKYYGLFGRIYLKKLIKITKFFIRNRESLRLRRTYIYAIIRNIFLRIGRNLAEDKVIENYRDVFFINKNELYDIVFNRTQMDVKSTIIQRKQEYKDNKVKDTFERMYFYGAIDREHMVPIYSEQEVTLDSGKLKGVAGGGKVVEGIVKYVESPNDCDINGYILMAKRTDPGWTILFPMAKAIIIERGSVLSHSAVIAREMGITLVVGVRGLTNIIKDGMKVRVDGVNGTIEILED